MATEHQGTNGNYSSQTQSLYTNDTTAFAAQTPNGNTSGMDYSSSAGATSGGGDAGAPASEVPKDEVGWYFVEQYYTTLSKNPEKLHLFYNKTSQFVSGLETEKSSVCVGQKAISDRIKELDFQDCKVRITNVDSQGSRSNIVIQVIGELSNKSAPQRKFTQTFVLAEQTNGYFVLNDMFRYILEDEENEEEQEIGNGVQTTKEKSLQTPVPTGNGEATPIAAPEATPHTLTSSEDPAEQARDVAKVKESLEAAIKDELKPEQTTDSPVQVPIAAELVHAEEAPAAATKTEDEKVDAMPVAPEAATQAAKAEEIAQPEKPKDPEPSPAAAATPKQASRPASPAPAPASALAQTQPPPASAPAPTPAKPAVPKTWASLVATAGRSAAATAASAVAAVAPQVAPTNNASSASAAQQPKAAAKEAAAPSQPAASAPAAVSPAPAAATADEAEQATAQSTGSGSEWQMAGDHHGKKAPRHGHGGNNSNATAHQGQHHQQHQQGQQPQPGENNRAYIKNVSEGIDGNALRAVLDRVAQVTYLDINRGKNCAFVDFATPAGYQAAVAANPHTVGDERLFIEERRVRPAGGFGAGPGGAYNNNNSNNNRGGGGARGGRGGAEGGRQQGGQQGGQQGQGRGGGFAGGNKEGGGGGRGGFGGRGRGGAGAGRGRGGGSGSGGGGGGAGAGASAGGSGAAGAA